MTVLDEAKFVQTARLCLGPDGPKNRKTIGNKGFSQNKARCSCLDYRNDSALVQLIIATEAFENVPLRRIPGGYEAVLANTM